MHFVSMETTNTVLHILIAYTEYDESHKLCTALSTSLCKAMARERKSGSATKVPDGKRQ
jgi:hypothetical protein